MKQIALFILTLAVLILFSCKKDNIPESTPPILQDTIGTGWKKIFLNDTTQSTGDIFFIGNTGFCISENTIYKSVDGGNNWSKTFLPTFGFFNLGMGNEQNAIFVGVTSKVIITHNAGISFDTVTLQGAHSDVFFVNSTTAYITGNIIWKTTDAGYTWLKVYEFNPQNGFTSVHFINEQTGWLVSKDGLLKTTNGGVNWQAVSTGSILNFNTLTTVFFPDSTHGYISDIYSIASSNNGGASWTKSYTGDNTYHDLHFVSPNIGYITDRSLILKTTDGGMTWNKEVVLPGRSIIELHFTDADHGWACGPKGFILKYEK